MTFTFKKDLNKKGQGSIEYLLIISGALVVAVLVIVLVTSLSGSNREIVSDAQDQYGYLVDNTIIPPIITDADCNSASQIVLLYINPSPTDRVKGYVIKVDGDMNMDDILTYNQGVISTTPPTPLDDGNAYKISAIALKNNTQSTPSTPAWSCKAHN